MKARVPDGVVYHDMGTERIMDVKGILFDSGGVLTFPLSGSWWPGFRFESILRSYGIEASRASKNMPAALDEGLAYLDANHFVVDLEQEKDQFRKFYRILCDKLEIGENERLIEDLASAYVEQCNFQLYPDTVPTLVKLKNAGIILGIVSDAWPSLHNKYLSLGIRHYFASFIVSAEVGVCKPNELIYRKAIESIGIDPGDLLFVDDDTDNVRAAIGLGMKGIVMLRNADAAGINLPVARDLNGILRMLTG